MAIPAQVRFEIDLSEEEYQLVRKFRVSTQAQQLHAISALNPEVSFGSIEKLVADAEALRQEISPEALKLLTDWRNLGPELMHHSESDEGDWSLDG